jgi:universal bacterial protein YeaZ
MRVLGLDTTRDKLVIVLTDGDTFKKAVVSEGNKKHTSLLLPTVDNLLSESGLSLSDIDCFAAVVGAGSFTGIRIGVATANALAYAQKKPLISVTAFDLIAYNKADGVCLIDALHGNFYGANVVGGRALEPRFYEAGDVPDCIHYPQDVNDDYAKAFASVLTERAEKGEFTSKLVPLYLRASQAEREAGSGI